MEITRISNNEAQLFSDHLQRLVLETIKLPDIAIRHYLKSWNTEKVINQLNDYIFLLAKEENQVLGLVLGAPPEGGVGTIIWVLVDEKAQKKGVGKELFNQACNDYILKGAHKVKLTVPDEKTVEFYLKQGMITEGIHRNHWWNHDFWSMGINLK